MDGEPSLDKVHAYISQLFTDFQNRHPNDPNIGNTGPFWIGSGMCCRLLRRGTWLNPLYFVGLAIFSAIITFLFIRPLSHDGMAEEDRQVSICTCSRRRCWLLMLHSKQFREYLEAHGYDTSQMGLMESETTSISSTGDEKTEKV